LEHEVGWRPAKHSFLFFHLPENSLFVEVLAAPLAVLSPLQLRGLKSSNFSMKKGEAFFPYFSLAAVEFPP